MHTRVVKPKHGPEILVRPLRDGDVDTVWAVFARLSQESRRTRFLGPKLELGQAELCWLAKVGPDHHALVAFVDRDPAPVAIARLVRLDGGGSAEIAFEVADQYQGRGIGSALARLLVADARAAGICEVTALVRSDNPAALALLRRVLGRLEVRLEGPDTFVRALLPGCA
jgi:ribosomal protein S18 acetylase RimI-like enzyme